MNEVLSFSQVTKTFLLPDGSDFYVLKNVTFQIFEGEIVALTGSSGSGKTTCLTMAGGLEPCSQGQIAALGTEYQTCRSDFEKMRQKRIRFVLQRAFLIHELSVLENVMIGDREGACKQRACTLLKDVEIEESLWMAKPSVLSGGQAQRVAIARALITEPSLLICDEPTAGLDHVLAHQIFGLLQRCVSKKKMSVFMATHDLSLARRADRIMSLNQGLLQVSGAEGADPVSE